MKAKGKFYHEEKCFRCSVCSCSLKEVPIFIKDDVLFCEDDYKAKFVPKCAKCNGYITEVWNNIGGSD